MNPQPTPEAALASLASCINTDRWPGLLDLMRVLLAKDGKIIADQMTSPAQFAERFGVSLDVAYSEFAEKPTVRIGKRRFMTETTIRRYFLNREA